MKARIAGAVIAVAIAGCESGSNDSVPVAPEYQLVFEDDFETAGIDSGKWTVAVGDGCPALCGDSSQPRRYAATNVDERDGALRIQAQHGIDGAMLSGGVHTRGKFAFRYGRLEVAARLPADVALRPAIRLLPADEGRFGPWPSSGEIALVEGFAAADGSAAVRSATRYGLPTPPHLGAAAVYDLGHPSDTRLVEYALEWGPGELRFFLDGEHVHTQSADQWYAYYPADADGNYDSFGAYRSGAEDAPFNQPFHLAIDLAAPVDGEPTLPATLEVDAVRIYQCVGGGANDDACSTRSESADMLADNAGGPLEDAQTGRPFVERLELYADGPATLAIPVDDADVEAVLTAETRVAPGATVASDPQFASPDDADNSVWRFTVAGGDGQALLTVPNRSANAMLTSGFDFSGHRLAGPGSDPVGEIVFDMYAESLAETATLAVGLGDGYPLARAIDLRRDRIPLGAWKTHSAKLADLAEADEENCCDLDLASVERPFMLHVRGGDAELLLDNIRVTNACKVVGGCGANASEIVSPRRACTSGERLRFGFYAFFAPVSYSADEDPDSTGFNDHRGFESDLLTALESLNGAGLAFSRHPITLWPNIWLRSASEYDVVGGGITILESRTRNAAGETLVQFTTPHIGFEQSLLVRSEDAERLATHAALTGDVRVGVLAGTTGEARLLELTGLTDADGNLLAGTRVETPTATLVADGTESYRITSAGTTENLLERTRLHPPNDSKPQVIYLGAELGERELLQALEDGNIDAIARGTIGNSDAAVASNNRFVVTARDPDPEYGGWTIAANRPELRACLNDKIHWLTNGGRIGYPQWRADQTVFMRRAEVWNEF